MKSMKKISIGLITMNNTYDENNLKDFRIVVQFQATDYEDAEDFVYSMNPKDWLEHLEEKGVL